MQPFNFDWRRLAVYWQNYWPAFKMYSDIDLNDFPRRNNIMFLRWRFFIKMTMTAKVYSINSDVSGNLHRSRQGSEPCLINLSKMFQTIQISPSWQFGLICIVWKAGMHCTSTEQLFEHVRYIRSIVKAFFIGNTSGNAIIRLVGRLAAKYKEHVSDSWFPMGEIKTNLVYNSLKFYSMETSTMFLISIRRRINSSFLWNERNI